MCKTVMYGMRNQLSSDYRKVQLKMEKKIKILQFENDQLSQLSGKKIIKTKEHKMDMEEQLKLLQKFVDELEGKYSRGVLFKQSETEVESVTVGQLSNLQRKVKDINSFVKKTSNRKSNVESFVHTELPVIEHIESTSSTNEKRLLIESIQKELEELTSQYTVHRQSLIDIQIGCQRVFKDIVKEFNLDIGQNYTLKPKL
jgi:hypothetical protein